MQSIINFFNQPFFIIAWGIATLAVIIGLLYTTYLVFRGIIPVWYRLWFALSKRKIAIFASSEFESIKSMLVDSKIFEDENIIRININDLRKAEKETIFLVHWKDYKNNISTILSMKKDSTPLIVYAPQNEGRIEPQEVVDEINWHRNSVIVNFRGRLLNDILTSMITTSYEKR